MTIESATNQGASSETSIEQQVQERLYPTDKKRDEGKQKIAPKNNVSNDIDDQENLDDQDDTNDLGLGLEDQDAEGENDLDEGDQELEPINAAILAKQLGLDETQLSTDEEGKVLVKVKVDGKESQVPMDDVIKSYQLQQHVNQKSMKLSELQKGFEAEMVNVKQDLFVQHQYNIGVTQLAEEMLLKDYNSINWESLKHTNGQQYAVLRQDFVEKAAAIQNLQKQVATEAQKFLHGVKNEMSAAQKAHLAEQRELMLIDNPHWANDNVRAKEQAALRDFVVSRYGFEAADMHLVTDRRLLQMIQDAYKYNAGKQKLQKQVNGKQLPKFQKKGVGLKQQTNQSEKSKQIVNRFQKSGRADDLTEVLKQRLG